jgi:hypothetical protein
MNRMSHFIIQQDCFWMTHLAMFGYHVWLDAYVKNATQGEPEDGRQ